jgi:hypothetical protein
MLSRQLSVIKSALDQAGSASEAQSAAEVAADAAEWEFALRVAVLLQPLIDARRKDNDKMIAAGGITEQEQLQSIEEILRRVGLLETRAQ